MSKDSQFSLSVNGRAELPLLAERAIINVSVSSEGLDKAKVSTDIISAAKQIESMLREMSAKDETPAAKAAAALAHWSKTSLSATSYVPPAQPRRHSELFREEAKEPPRRYRGIIQFDVRFKDFNALGSFSTRISSIEHVEVKDINWTLTEVTEAKYRSQLRKDAAKDALAKAQDYCEVLGCVKLRPEKMQDHTFTNHGQAAHGMQMHSMARMGRVRFSEVQDEAKEELEFTPQEIKMTMDVSVSFRAEPVF